MSQDVLVAQVSELVDAEPLWISALANVSAQLMSSLDQVSWCGFYLRRPTQSASAAVSTSAQTLGSKAVPASFELVLGPFQGGVACTRIAWGKGVCGTAAAQDATQLVPNVHEFAGHIACDSATNSEVVVPVHAGGQVVVVLDLDSHAPARFDAADAKLLERVVATLEQQIDWSGWLDLLAPN